MSLYTCFDLFKKFSNVRNLKIDVVLKVSRVVVIGWFSLNEALLALFECISDYLQKFELIYEKLSKLFVRIIRNNLNQVVHTLG